MCDACLLSLSLSLSLSCVCVFHNLPALIKDSVRATCTEIHVSTRELVIKFFRRAKQKQGLKNNKQRNCARGYFFLLRIRGERYLMDRTLDKYETSYLFITLLRNLFSRLYYRNLFFIFLRYKIARFFYGVKDWIFEMQRNFSFRTSIFHIAREFSAICWAGMAITTNIIIIQFFEENKDFMKMMKIYFTIAN